MAEEVLFKSESRRRGGEVADYLRTVADKLDQGEAIELRAGSESMTVDPPGDVEFEVKVEREGTEKSLELELEWDESDPGNGPSGELDIE